ncbi:MAG: DUF2782 domain-containing protein [Rehaibacterium terrae]|uniref:DUF2782 domain-containing protein n=1 Tax=Rehaibacterium terrae TaxID=1341696 RepID=UPI003919A22C
MRRPLIAFSLLLALPALAQQSTPRELLAQERDAVKEVPIPEKIPAPAEREPPPAVRILVDERTGDRIEEYRVNGRLHMVKVTPRRGPPYYLLDTNGDGRLDSKDGEGPVRPVYWVVYQWD